MAEEAMRKNPKFEARSAKQARIFKIQNNIANPSLCG
jgi:hypothetical protein